jgi:hypothetical protein
MGRVRHFESIGIVEFPPPAHEENAPEAWLRFGESGSAELGNFFPGEEIQVLIYFDPVARLQSAALDAAVSYETFREILAIPSPPNPLRVHRVTVLAREGHRLRVRGLIAIEGMEVFEVTSVLERSPEH